MSALGTEFKINVNAEPIEGFHMSDYDFECILYVYTNRSVTFRKGDSTVKKTDDDNYRVIVNSEDCIKLGRGEVKLRFIAHIPDADFKDGYRTEIVNGICTGETIT